MVSGYQPLQLCLPAAKLAHNPPLALVDRRMNAPKHPQRRQQPWHLPVAQWRARKEGYGFSADGTTTLLLRPRPSGTPRSSVQPSRSNSPQRPPSPWCACALPPRPCARPSAGPSTFSTQQTFSPSNASSARKAHTDTRQTQGDNNNRRSASRAAAAQRRGAGVRFWGKPDSPKNVSKQNDLATRAAQISVNFTR